MKAWRKAGTGRYSKDLFKVRPFPSVLLCRMMIRVGLMPKP